MFVHTRLVTDDFLEHSLPGSVQVVPPVQVLPSSQVAIPQRQVPSAGITTSEVQAEIYVFVEEDIKIKSM